MRSLEEDQDAMTTITTPAPLLLLRVAQPREPNPLIRLRAADGAVLPGYSAGARVNARVELPGGRTDWRPRARRDGLHLGAPRERRPPAASQEWEMTIEQAIEPQAVCMMTEDFSRPCRAFVAKAQPRFEGD